MRSTGISSSAPGCRSTRCCMEHPACDRSSSPYRSLAVVCLLGRSRLRSGLLGNEYADQLRIGQLGVQRWQKPPWCDCRRARGRKPRGSALVMGSMASARRVGGPRPRAGWPSIPSAGGDWRCLRHLVRHRNRYAGYCGDISGALPSMIPLVATLFLVATSGPAAAHGDVGEALGTTATWTYDPWVVVPLYSSALLYLVGSHRIWRHAGTGRGVRHWQVACFWTGWTLLALALLSPLHWLGERLFVAHMVEHEVLMVLAAPLLAVARPVGAFLWAMPVRWRKRLGRAAQNVLIAAPWRIVRLALVATGVHAIALWIWHMPLLYNLVLTDTTWHRLQHASFFFTALLFWWSLFYGPARLRGDGVAVACLFFTSLHSAILGIFLTLARQPWYPQQEEFAAFCGLTPLEDQQLAGLVMWVPPGFVYLGFALYFAGQWISRASLRHATGGMYASART